jgi:DNA replication protein DnaC
MTSLSLPTCPKCGGNGVFIANSPQYPEWHGKSLICTCEAGLKLRQERAERLRAISDIPPRLAHLSFQTYLDLPLSDDQQAAARICMAYTRGGELRTKEGKPKRGIYLFGPIGTGKSGLAAAIANAAMEQANQGVLYRTAPDLLDYIRSTFKENSTVSYDQVIEQIKRVDLLVLDDFGTETMSPWVAEKLFQIIDFRYRYEMRLIVTSNLDLASLRDHFKADVVGERIVDRIREICAVVEVAGKSLR